MKFNTDHDLNTNDVDKICVVENLVRFGAIVHCFLRNNHNYMLK